MCLIRLKAFRELWEEGFSYYLAGRWEDAKEVFSKTLCMLPNYIDGPSNTLLKVIEEELPNNWKGYRPLLEK
jgi:hypothetical protein